MEIFYFHKFEVTDTESVNNILKFLLSNIYFKYVLSPGLYFVRFWDADFWAYKKLQFQQNFTLGEMTLQVLSIKLI